MTLFYTLVSLLRRPFPDEPDLLRSIIRIAVIGLFVGIFLYFFGPFGLSAIPTSERMAICGIFGGITFSIHLLYTIITIFVFRIHRDIPSFTFVYWIADNLVLLFLISMGNFAYMNYLGFMGFQVSSYVFMLLATLGIGLFPLLYMGMSRMANLQSQHQQIARYYNKAHQKYVKSTRSIKLIFDIDPNAILYCEAFQNYVTLHYLHYEHIKQKTERITLSELASQLADSSVIRCHRSYLVNSDMIETIGGNAQGLQLSLIGLKETIVPVSRSFIHLFRS